MAAAPATASQVEAMCEAYVAENGSDYAGCACLGEAAPDGSALASAILAIESQEDYEASDQSVKDAVAACDPNAA